jgi:hypothetical protein
MLYYGLITTSKSRRHPGPPAPDPRLPPCGGGLGWGGAAPAYRRPSRCSRWRSVEQRSNGLFLEENRKVFIRCSVAHTKWGYRPRRLAGSPYRRFATAAGARRTGNYSSSLFNWGKLVLGTVKGFWPAGGKFLDAWRSISFPGSPRGNALPLRFRSPDRATRPDRKVFPCFWRPVGHAVVLFFPFNRKDRNLTGASLIFLSPSNKLQSQPTISMPRLGESMRRHTRH